jgi:hypothetical protein
MSGPVAMPRKNEVVKGRFLLLHDERLQADDDQNEGNEGRRPRPAFPSRCRRLGLQRR